MSGCGARRLKMKRLLLSIAIAFGLLAIVSAPATAQGCGTSNPNCVAPTPPVGDNSNRIANTRWVQANGGGSTSILNFGAVCDGVTDDHAAFNAAITAVSAAGGGTVTVPAGKVCVVNGTVNLASNVTIQGSQGATVRVTSNFSNNLFVGQPVNNAGVQDLTIDGGSIDLGQNSLVVFSGSNNVWARRLNIINMGRFGITMSFSTDFDISGNQISCASPLSGPCGTINQNEGILVVDAYGAISSGRIVGNTLNGTGTDIGAANTVIANNVISNFHFGSGITTDIFSFCYNLTITNNVITGGANALDVNATYPGGIEHWCPDSIISHNVSYANGGEGMSLGGYNTTVTDNIIYDNGIAHSGLNGISARFGTATNFTGSISGTTLTVTGSCTGSPLGPRAMIFGAGVTQGTIITANGTGTGCAGTYTVNFSQTVGSEAMTWSVGAQGSTLAGNVVFNTLGTGGTQAYSYQEQATSPALFNIFVDPSNQFGPGNTGSTSLASQSVQGVIYARQFGVSTSNPDNTAAMTAALNVAMANNARLLQLPPGVLQFCSQMQWGAQSLSGLTIAGAGDGSSAYSPNTSAGQGTVIQACPTFGGGGVIQVVIGANSGTLFQYGGGIRDLSFDGNNLAAYGLIVKDMANGNFKNLTFYKHAGGAAIEIANSTNSGAQLPTAKNYFENIRILERNETNLTTQGLNCNGITAGGSEGITQNTFNGLFIDHANGPAITIGEDCDQEYITNLQTFRANAETGNAINTYGDGSSVIGNWHFFGVATTSNWNIACCSAANVGWNVYGLATATGSFNTGVTEANFLTGSGASGVSVIDQFGNMLNFNSMILLPVTIAQLPSCSGTTKGKIAFVSDTVANAAASFHGTVTGGGATTVNSPVSCNGSNWQYD